MPITRMKENITNGFRYLFNQFQRSFLTVIVIVIGIMALVGMLTAIEGLKSSVVQNFAQMGSNSFMITDELMFRNSWGMEKEVPEITYRQAVLFQKKYDYPETFVSVHYTATSSATARYKSKKTTPKIMVVGADENYFITSSLEIEKGRSFSRFELNNGVNVAIIGTQLKRDLFENENPLGKILTVNNGKYKIIGILKEKGSTFGFSYDNLVILPIQTARKSFISEMPNYKITIHTHSIEKIDAAVERAIALFRTVRKLSPADKNNFKIERSDSLVGMVSQNLSVISIITIVVSIITLVSSSVSLMNIMLVSVKERIREIGTLKALGATINDLKIQFISEAISVSQLGGILGIIFGIVVGNIIGHQMGSIFVIPWFWIITAYIVSIVVGLVAGYYPAIRAARLNPIDALRYE